MVATLTAAFLFARRQPVLLDSSQRFALCAFEVRLKKPQLLALATTKNFGGFYASSAGTGSAPSARDFDDASDVFDV